MRGVLLISALLLVVCSMVSAQNVLVNPGFEQTPVPLPDDPIPGWTYTNEAWTDMTDFHYEVQSEDVYSGSNALRLYLGPESWGAGWSIYQTASVTPGDVYEVSAMWKCSGADPGDINQVTMLVFPGSWWDNKNENAIYAVRSETNAYNHPPFHPINFDWDSTKNAPFTAYEPAEVVGTAHLRSRIKSTSMKMTVWFKITSAVSPTVQFCVDDVVMQKVSAAYSVSGTVTDSVTGRPIPNATVTCSTGGTAVSDENGIYRIEFPDAGACTFSASAEHYFDSTGLPATLGAKTNAVFNINMTPKPTGTLSGAVTDGSAPLPNAKVWTTTGGYSTTADENGNYSMEVEAGDYTVEANAVGYETASLPANVVTAQVTTLNIVLTERYVNPQNALINGDFEDGLNAWTLWMGVHYTDHVRYDPTCPGYGDQWVGATLLTPQALAGEGVNGSTSARMDLATTGTLASWGTCGGLRQECYVTPGKYYRVRCKWKGSITGEADNWTAGLALLNERFDPGAYMVVDDPPPHVDDVVQVVSHQRHYYEMGDDSVPEANRWWHNIMASRNKSAGNTGTWDWRDSMENLEPKNNLVGAVKQATGETMTVVLYFSCMDWEESLHYVDFDDVVLEEVSGFPPVTLQMLNNVDTRPAYNDCPAPEINVDLTGSPSVVTGTFQDLYGYSCYVEDQNRTTAFRVDITDMFTPFVGDTITFKGVLGSNDLGERRILMEEGSGVITGSAQVPAPLGIGIKNLSTKFRYQNPLNDISGPGNLGLLITTWGSVVSSFNDGWYDWVRIDDGTGREVWVSGWIGQPNPGDYVSATGILGITEMLDQEGMLYPVYLLKVRDDTAWDDFQVIQQ